MKFTPYRSPIPLMGHRPKSIHKWHNRKESLTNVVITTVFSKARS